jgi:hypothetical protein
MTRKIYRTAQGKMVDLGALQLQNENVRAVGNMKVNARGDLIDSANQPIDSRNKQVAKQYRRQTTNVKNDPVRSSQESAPPVPKPPEDFNDDFVKSKPVTKKAEEPTVTESPVGGLAAAIARAREIRQDPLKTHQNIAEHQTNSTKS